MDFPVSKFAHNKPIPPISLYYYYEKYKSLYNDYVLCPDFNNELPHRRDLELSHRRDLNRTLVVQELELVENVALQHATRSGGTSPMTSEKYFTGEEHTDASQSSDTSLNYLVNRKDLDNLLIFLNEVENNDELSEKVSNPGKMLAHKTHDPVSLWSKILSVTDQTMQMNIQSGITDSSFQLLLGILVCDGLATSCVTRLYDILQPYVSPVESAVIIDDIVSSSCVQSPTNNAKQVKQKDEEQQCYVDEGSLRFVLNKVENRTLGSYNRDAQSSKNNSLQCICSVEDIKQHMDKWFRDLDELREIIHNAESDVELKSDDCWPAVHCEDSTFDHMDEDLLTQYPKYENPMLKIVSEFKMNHDILDIVC